MVDDKEWEKVCKGVYTGFSFGGSYGKRWIDADGNKRYTAIRTELSLGDYPAIPTATFTLVKISGIEERVPFRVAAGNINQEAAVQFNGRSFLQKVIDAGGP